mmetsp:Transcript_58750/g.131380  ORF Transcript_58750/g.131380 Transcript_58750/m.131380 type:complete len:501 (+) Transcript_58750:125-1627(+)
MRPRSYPLGRLRRQQPLLNRRVWRQWHQTLRQRMHEHTAELQYINDYCQRRLNGVVECSWTADKGRILKANKPFKVGDEILREHPLHVVAEDRGGSAFDEVAALCAEREDWLDPLWYWAGLNSLLPDQLPQGETRIKPVTADQQKQILLLYCHDITEASEASKQLVSALGLTSRLNPVDLERLLQRWIFNCFEHSDSPLAYSMYFMSSFMSHGCLPNAVWHHDNDDFTLRARRDIQVGDEIVVSYLSEEALLESTPARRQSLQGSKDFLCSCDRCAAGLDTCRGFRLAGSTIFPDPATPDNALAFSMLDHTLTDVQVRTLRAEEHWFATQVQTWGARIEDKYSRADNLLVEMERGVQRAERTLAQHWLLDRAWKYLSRLYDSEGRVYEAEAALNKRIAYQVSVYPGLCGEHAWTLETYGDLLLKHHGLHDDSNLQAPRTGYAAAAVKAKLLYADAMKILRDMFGDKHEYFTNLEEKVGALDKRLKRCKNTLSCASLERRA